jgi:succinoglycan biosynthesis protein ExoA
VIGLAGSLLAPLFGAGGTAVVVPAVYAAALLTGTLSELVHQRSRAALMFPAAVATMHIAWGAGFLAESLRIAPEPAAR